MPDPILEAIKEHARIIYMMIHDDPDYLNDKYGIGVTSTIQYLATGKDEDEA